MRVLVSLVLVSLVSCKKSAPAEVDAGAPSLAPPALRALPSAPSTLSLLEPVDTGCVWRTLEPTTSKSSLIATLPGSCIGARIAWSPGATKALVWFDPQHVVRAGYFADFASKPAFPDEQVDERAKPRLFSVDVRSGAVTPVPFPPATAANDLEDLGLGADGVPLALFTQTLNGDDAEKKSLSADGQTFDLSEIHEGAPALARAFRFSNGAWVRTETAVTTTGWDYALGARVLKAADAMGPRSAQLSTSMIGGDSAEEAEVKALRKLQPAKATDDDGDWVFTCAGGARLYVWEISGEFAHSTGLIATGTPPAKLQQLDFTDGDLVALRTSGPFVLVTASDVGAHPRLYRLPEGTRVFASESARAVTFWPGTAKPETHEDSH